MVNTNQIIYNYYGDTQGNYTLNSGIWRIHRRFGPRNHSGEVHQCLKIPEKYIPRWLVQQEIVWAKTKLWGVKSTMLS